MRVFESKPFMRFARKAGIDDAALCAAVGQIKRGLYAANLGGGVVKHRIARRGQGKSGGFRVLIVFEAGASAFFVHGFAKNEKGDIRRDELLALKKLASELLAYDDNAIARAVNSGALIEVFCDEKTIS